MPVKSSEHWTAESIGNFTYRIAADFLAQVEIKIENGEISRTELAQRLDRTPGRVSQLFNNPGNLTVTSAVRLSRAAGMKVALVAYEDNDPQNNKGPVNSAIFYQCWKDMGAPKTFFELNSATTPAGITSAGSCFISHANSSSMTVLDGSKTTATTAGPLPADGDVIFVSKRCSTSSRGGDSFSPSTVFVSTIYA